MQLSIKLIIQAYKHVLHIYFSRISNIYNFAIIIQIIKKYSKRINLQICNENTI